MVYYSDASTIIYLVERISPFYERASQKLRKPDVQLAILSLSGLETRVKPLRDQNHILLQELEEFFAFNLSLEIDITREVIDKATELRAKYSFKTPDAIHLAAAILGGCDVFLTNDLRLKRCNEIQVETLEPDKAEP